MYENLNRIILLHEPFIIIRTFEHESKFKFPYKIFNLPNHPWNSTKQTSSYKNLHQKHRNNWNTHIRKTQKSETVTHSNNTHHITNALTINIANNSYHAHEWIHKAVNSRHRPNLRNWICNDGSNDFCVFSRPFVRFRIIHCVLWP